MATTVTFNTATPYSLVGIVASDTGVANTATQATMLAACAEGPLKEFLSRTPVTSWPTFNLGQALCNKVRVREVVERGAVPDPKSLEFLWTATGIKFNCTAASAFQFEIRLVGSERF